MPLNSFKPAEIIKAINTLESVIQTFKISSGPGISINQTSSGFMISATGSGSGSAAVYTGMLKVTLESGKLRIRDGMDPTAEVAGFLYHNQKYRECPAAELSPEEGFLCVSCNSAGDVRYSIESAPPDMPILETTTADDTAKYPIALIKKDGNSYSIRQLLRYAPPIMYAFGPCDEE